MPYQLHQGDCQKVLATLPDSSVHCCVTSPPYFGLRDYGVSGQIGLELTPVDYIDRLVEVFGEVRRVLHPTGTLWLNLGDSYANDAKWGGRTGGKHREELHGQPIGRIRRFSGLKPKDLMGIPWRVALALQEDGWWLRRDIIWNKPNAMPESVTDRPTTSHEYVFLMSKSERYFYDNEAVREPGPERTGKDGTFGMRSKVEQVGPGQLYSQHREDRDEPVVPGRNRRSVWTISTEAYPEAHFATFPTALVEPCILAGTSAYGTCPTSGAPWTRVTEKVGSYQGRWSTDATKISATHHDIGYSSVLRTAIIPIRETTGWAPTCNCECSEVVPATVLDPFAGSGTTGAVACALGRNFIGIELNPAYVELAHKRIGAVQPAMIGF